jgi:hypothetical protein
MGEALTSTSQYCPPKKEKEKKRNCSIKTNPVIWPGFLGREQ